jgi:hypothetical protein
MDGSTEKREIKSKGSFSAALFLSYSKKIKDQKDNGDYCHCFPL